MQNAESVLQPNIAKHNAIRAVFISFMLLYSLLNCNVSADIYTRTY